MGHIKRTISLTRSNLKTAIRNKSALSGVVLFPLVFIGIFGIAFQASDPMNSTYNVGIVLGDAGIPEGSIVPFGEENVTGNYFSDLYIEILESATYDDNETKVFATKSFTLDQVDLAEQELEKRELYMVIELPENFSLFMMGELKKLLMMNPVMAQYTHNWTGYDNVTELEMTIRGDSTLAAFGTLSNAVRQITTEFFDLDKSDNVALEVVVEGTVDSEGLRVFDIIFPGLIIFGILQNISLVSAFAFSDIKKGVLQRLRNSHMTASDYVTAQVLTQLVMSMAQIPVFYIAGAMFGFPLTAEIWSVFLVGVLLALSVTGIGLIIAGLSKTEEDVSSVSLMVSVPMAFLSGSFFIIPNPEIIPRGSIFGENSILLFDFLSSSSALRIIRGVLLTDRVFADYLFDLVLVAITTVIYLGIGILLFARRHISAKN